MFFIKAGTLHAIGKGILIAEIQQNSNTTYRVSDYGRLGADGKPRELHVKKAVDVTVTDVPTIPYGNVGEVKSFSYGTERQLAECEYFNTLGVLHKLDARLKRKATEVALAAPTGMAAKRLVNSTGQEAKTIHKLLEYHPDAPFQMHCEDNPIAADYVILDETSMIDIDITAMLLKAVMDTTQVLFVGDTDQLPSIGPGEVLADLIASGLFQIVRLKRSFRHGSRKHILENAAKIIQGNISLDTRHSDFQFYEVPDLPEDKECRRLLWKLKRVFFEEYAAMGRNCEMVQVLSPMRVKTLVSADQMNAQLQNMVNARLN